MSQNDRHLTTEQISAFLDHQLSIEEQVEYDVHLQSCAQCQQELTSLRATVALLHALPTPALPRSFVLPLEISATDEVQSSPDSAPMLITSSRRRRSDYWRNTLRLVSALAAILGIVFLLSIFPSLPHGGASSASSSAGMAVPQARSVPASPGSGIVKGQAQVVTATPLGGIQSPTTAASVSANDNTFSNADSNSPQQLEKVPVSPSPPSFVLLFFNLSSPDGRVGLGILLVIVGIMGLILSRRRRARSQEGID